MSLDSLVVQNLERWKEHLLDTSKRNRLLYFDPKYAVELLEPSLETLWQRLIKGGKSQTFQDQSEDEGPNLFGEPEFGEARTNAAPRALKSDEMRAQPCGAALGRMLYGLRSKSNLSLEEQGLTTLYVAWGLLRWRDPITKNEVASPLILAPMTLIRESSRAPYRLKLSEETLWLNPALEWKLATDFRLALPAIPDFEDANPAAYFAQVRKLVAAQPGWSVSEAAYLGLFSFHKMAMYQDLCDGQTLALANPFVRALGGDASRLPPSPPDLPAGAALDELSPRDSFGVLDCDSSQREAIEAARAGVSFVLQGPPGTGKSQTITNMIAHALADGKQVLFVSEKMAALDVVHSRLEAVGLAPFCLKAHSQSATKKEVIADLGRTLNAARTGAQIGALRGAMRQDASEADELARLRAGLNLYASELHAPRSPLRFSVYEAVGQLAALADAPEIAAPLGAPFETDDAAFQHCRELLNAATYSQDVWRAGASQLWHGARAQPFTLDLRATITARGAQAARQCHELLRQTRERATACGLGDTQFSLEQAARLPDLVELMRELEHVSHRPPAMWFVAEDLQLHLDLAAQFKARFADLRARREALGARYKSAFWQLPHAGLIERVTTKHAQTLERGGTWEQFPDWGEELARRLHLSARHLEQSAHGSAAIAGNLGLTAPGCLSQIGVFANALAVLERDWRAPRAVAPAFFDGGQTAPLQSALDEARSHARARDALADKLANYDLAALENAELTAIKTRFETRYGGFLRFLKSDYKRDLVQLAGWRTDGAKLNYEAARADLVELCAWQNAHCWLRDAATSHGQLFGEGFSGRATDWDALEADLQASAQLAQAFAALGGVPHALNAHLVSGQSATGLLSLLPELRASLLVLREELPWLQRIFDLKNLPFQNVGVALTLAQAPSLPMAAWLHAQGAALADITAAFAQWTNEQIVADNLPQTLVADAREALAIAVAEAALEGESAQLRARFGALFCEDETDWDAVSGLLSWTQRALDWWRNWARNGGQSAENSGASGEFIDLASGARAFVAPQLAWCEGELRAQWEYFGSLFEAPIGASDDLETDATWFDERGRGAAALEEYLRWQTLAGELREARLWELWEAAREMDIDNAALMGAFEKRFWSLWLDGALANSAALASFAGARHQDASAKFCRLDANELGGARRRLGEILWEKKPRASGAKTGEIAILQKEINKKARQWPVRKLFREIPHLLNALKPCLLMSPLAVAQFLEAGRAQFDLVIFDEASQICPEDAVGAILRSRQLIVVGDRRQLPPSRFFATSANFDDDNEDDEDESALFESILDMCAPHLRNWMLLWHYRSRDESLISFSNQHFYEGKLITFPGPFAQSPPHRGLQLESVAGVYYRGKDPRARTNPIEAARVAALIIAHVRREPTRTLGVIALNATQGRAIEIALFRELADAPELESWFNSAKREPFFIKALENVQGDERDAILLSIGYGPDEGGKISMNFGPLNKEGGERRLNVAVTRARESLTVVSSLAPEQIDLNRISKIGPKLLRAFLEAARRGGDNAPLEAGANDEGLVDSVESALNHSGWKTRRGIGRSALRIDIAVEHPTRAGEWLLGIECDGGDYASAPVARDRERIRPAVLSGMGWKLERVWCLDWLKNPAAELQRLERALQTALVNAPEAELVQTETELSQTEMELFISPESWEEAELQSTNFEDSDAPELGAMAPIYRPVELGFLGWQDDFRELGAHDPKLQGAITRITEAEAPIHRDALVAKIARAWEFGRAGSSVADKVWMALRVHTESEMRGDFVWQRGQTQVAFRRAGRGESPRPIEQIAPEEIGDAMLFCIAQAVGLEREDLVRQTAKTLGFNRTGAQITATVGAVLETLLREGQLSERAGAIGKGEVS